MSKDREVTPTVGVECDACFPLQLKALCVSLSLPHSQVLGFPLPVL